MNNPNSRNCVTLTSFATVTRKRGARMSEDFLCDYSNSNISFLRRPDGTITCIDVMFCKIVVNRRITRCRNLARLKSMGKFSLWHPNLVTTTTASRKATMAYPQLLHPMDVFAWLRRILLLSRMDGVVIPILPSGIMLRTRFLLFPFTRGSKCEINNWGAILTRKTREPGVRWRTTDI